MLQHIQEWLSQHPDLRAMIILGGVLFLSWLSYIFTRRFLLRLLARLARKSQSELDDIILEKVVSRRLAYLAPVLVMYYLINLVPVAVAVVQPVLLSLMALIVVLSIGALLDQLNTRMQMMPAFRGKPVKSYVQVAKLVLYLAGGILLVGLLTGSSPLAIFSGIGAMTAIVILIFRDTILSFIASLQISSSDLIRLGDWIEVPQFGADGEVIDMALHTVKIQNWDKTITVIPTHKVIDATFKNWRGMQQSGGRRIKRAIYIDLATIRFCDDELIERLSRLQLLRDYLQRKREEIDASNREKGIDDSLPGNGRRMTNIGTFRAYVEAYLRQNTRLNQGLTCLVRQLPPGPQGLPIEVYVFTNDTAWANYEAIQADIFDHLLAIVPQFDLRIFQNPSGHDIARLGRT